MGKYRLSYFPLETKQNGFNSERDNPNDGESVIKIGY